jgi:hypothetical protein
MAPPDFELTYFTISYIHPRQREISGYLHAWSTVLHFNNPITEQMLDYVCRSAYSQMNDAFDVQDLPDHRRPGTLAAMWMPRESIVIISSSIKNLRGAGTAKRYFYQNPRLKALLDSAVPQPHEQRHRTGGCAEIGCLSVWEKLFPQQQVPQQQNAQQQGGQQQDGQLRGSMIVTWGGKQEPQRIHVTAGAPWINLGAMNF